VVADQVHQQALLELQTRVVVVEALLVAPLVEQAVQEL
jgi:hypothetical protein